MKIFFTDRELDIMLVLWERGPSTVTEVKHALADDLARNTVLTMLKVLREKGYVERDERERTHRYFPLVGREAAGERAVGRLVGKLFRGSPALLFTQLVRHRDLSDEDLRAMRERIDLELGDQGRRRTEPTGGEG